jgi:hypothetical protein
MSIHRFSSLRDAFNVLRGRRPAHMALPVDVADVVAARVLGIGSCMSIRELATDAVSLSAVAH